MSRVSKYIQVAMIIGIPVVIAFRFLLASGKSFVGGRPDLQISELHELYKEQEGFSVMPREPRNGEHINSWAKGTSMDIIYAAYYVGPEETYVEEIDVTCPLKRGMHLKLVEGDLVLQKHLYREQETEIDLTPLEEESLEGFMADVRKLFKSTN